MVNLAAVANGNGLILAQIMYPCLEMSYHVILAMADEVFSARFFAEIAKPELHGVFAQDVFAPGIVVIG
jgi:hypothetical protein